MDIRLKILLLSSWFPYPPNNGSRIRVYNLIKELSKYHNITLLAFAQEDSNIEDTTRLAKYCQEVHSVPAIKYHPKSWRSVRGFFSPYPRYIVDTYSVEMKDLVAKVVENSSFDLIVASQVLSAPYVQNLNNIKKVFEEVELTVIYDQSVLQKNPFRRFRYGLTWWKARNYTKNLLKNFEACTVVSEEERQHVLECSPFSSIIVIPNGVDLNWYEDDYGTPSADTIIFPAPLSYFANLDGIRFFLDEVFQQILEKRPDTILRITGSLSNVRLENLSLNKNVILTGYLDDIRPAIAQSWLCIVPLRIGGGTRLKILESMALGTPVVSTTKGAEGLDVESEMNILIADDPESFANAVLRLLDDKNLRLKLSKNGRDLIHEEYDWGIIGKKYNTFLEQLVRGKV
jgi:glycosyltransferase involved in cell wall biosynthesis